MLRAIPIILVCLALVALPALAQETTTMAAGTAPTISQTDLLVSDIVTSYYGLDPAMVSQLQSRGYTPDDIAIAANLAARSGRPLTEITAMRTQGSSWTQIARSVNVPESQIWAIARGGSPGMMMSSAESDTFQHNWLRSTYGLSDRQIRDLRARGFGFGEIGLIANASRRTGKPISEIADLRASGMGWGQIASRYNVRVADLTNPAMGRVPVAGLPGRGPGMTAFENQSLTADEYNRLRVLGWSEEDMRVAAMIRARSNATLDEIVRLRMVGLSWFQIAENNNIPYREIERARNEPFWLP